MKDHKKLLWMIAVLVIIYSVVLIVNMIVNFRNYAIESEIKKEETIANLVKDGLTAHMSSGTMSQRKLFLENVKNSSKALKIWIFRTKRVEELFGKGFEDEYVRDDIDSKVIKTGKKAVKIMEDDYNPSIRITIPYIATSHSNPNCLKCHSNAKEGDVLGGISMMFDITEVRNNSILTVLKITSISILFIFVLMYFTNRYLKPYTNFIDNIKSMFKKVYKGNYALRIKDGKDNEFSDSIDWINSFMDKLEHTINTIEKNIALFVIDRNKKYQDPLEKSKDTVEDLAKIYKFKKTIELDIDKNVIYKRLVKIFKEDLNISDLSLYEVDIKNDRRALIYDDTPDKFCEIANEKTSIRCRAFRTNSVVFSDDFENICQACDTPKEYLCINFQINDDISLVLNIKPDTKEKLHQDKQAIGYIRNYLEAAKPVLESKILTDMLYKSNMIDGLTGLYNRKYLDEFMDKDIKDYKEYALAMIDIDYFKKVNDTYGHDAGDKVLKGLSDIFKRGIGKNDIAFRFGGEEFVILLPNVEEAYKTVERIKDNFEKAEFNLNGEKVKKTLSAGIAFYKNDGESPWKIIKQADIAMYEAKNSGRNRIVLYGDIKKKTVNPKEGQ